MIKITDIQRLNRKNIAGACIKFHPLRVDQELTMGEGGLQLNIFLIG